MESEFAEIIYAKINGIPWQPQIAEFVSRPKKTGYTVFTLAIPERNFRALARSSCYSGSVPNLFIGNCSRNGKDQWSQPLLGLWPEVSYVLIIVVIILDRI
jgi:hypothetical protein